MSRPEKKRRSGDKPKLSKNPTDERFKNFQTDPRFRLPSKSKGRVKVDERFSTSLKNDSDFTGQTKIDRYGRRLASNESKALDKLYDFEGSAEGVELESASGGSDNEIDDANVINELRKAATHYDPARHGGFSESSSEESDDDDEQEVDATEEVFGFAESRGENDGAVPSGEVTSRLAVVNLDWDNIRAIDLFAICSGFCTSGRLLKVTVYPSEFGKERIEREAREGPPKDIFQGLKSQDAESGSENEEAADEEEGSEDDDDDEKIKNSLLKDDTGEEFDSAKLRRYQLERLRYYYAVLTFSSKEAAKELYDTIDGTEYLSSANFFDLRFVPEDVSFEEDVARDECDEVPVAFTPLNFVTDALQHSKVKLTWDGDDNVRKDVISKAFSGSRREIEENDFKAYLNSGSSESEDEGSRRESGPALSKSERKEMNRQRLRAALGLGEKAKPSDGNDAPVGDMEVTFTLDASEKEQSDPAAKSKAVEHETTAETYIRKEKERKQKRKEKALRAREGKSQEEGQATELKEVPQEDLGFDDPFFNGEKATDSKKSKSQRRAERIAKENAKREANAISESERAKLEDMINDDEDNVWGKNTEHFNLKSILKNEKAKNKKSKKAKKAEVNLSDLQSGFELDANDPRFGVLFDDHEYAIDPTNSNFGATPDMKKLLEVARGKRKDADGRDVGPSQKKVKSSNAR